jgi:ParB family chromosome partitioning protein
LLGRFGRTQEEVAETVGKSRSHIANTVRLLDLPEAVLHLLRTRQLTAGHARAIAGAPDPAALAAQIVAQGLSVRAAEALGRRAQAPSKPGASRGTVPGAKDVNTRNLEADLAQALGLSVEITHKDPGGALTIRYQTLEQLDDICRRLMRGTAW